MALTVTVIGFFASLKFYRDGMEMQSRSEKALAKIEERASSIQTQVGGMFDKTLDAALSRTSAREAEQQQREILQSDSASRGDDGSSSPEGPRPQVGLASGTQAAQKVMRYMAFRGLRVTSITNDDALAIFNLGTDAGFNLFDGADSIVFWGYFVQVHQDDVVARTRILFSNIEITYANLNRQENTDPMASKRAKEILDRISVEILVEEDVNKEALESKISEFQPSVRTVQVVIHTPTEIDALLETEYQRMKVAN